MEVRCTQCGATLSVPADARLLQCTFCSTALVVDPEGVCFRETLMPTVSPAEVASHLRRFLASDDTVAGLDREARLGEPRLEMFPFWGFTVGDEGRERTVLMPAAPSALQGLQGLALPAGETASAGAQPPAPLRDPEVPLATARQWLEQRESDARVRRTVLYHLPLYRVAYTWRGRSYAAAVDGVSGRVYPADFPAKAEAPYLLVAGLAVAVFGLEGLVIGSVLLKVLVYLVSAVPLLGLAWWVTRKV